MSSANRLCGPRTVLPRMKMVLFMFTYLCLALFPHCQSSKDTTSSSPICHTRGGWNFRDESCYFVVKVSPNDWRPYTKVRFNDYRRACAKINATLPIVGSWKEQEFLRERTKYGDGLFNAFDYYLGIKHASAEGPRTTPRKLKWRWMDGKAASGGYTPTGWRFDPSYPCVTLGWTGWRNELCWQWDSRDLYAVCEKPYDSTCKENTDDTGC